MKQGNDAHPAEAGSQTNGKLKPSETDFDAGAITRLSNALKVSEAQFRAVGDIAPLGVYIINPDGSCPYINTMALEMLGLDREEARDRWPDVLHPDDKERVWREWSACREQGTLYKSRQRFVRPVGDTVWVNVVATPVKDGDTLLCFVGTIEDITELMQTDVALRQSEEQYRQIIDTAQEGVWLINKEARTAFVNQRMADMLGYTISEMMDASIDQFMDNEARGVFERQFEQRKQGLSAQYDFRFRHKNGADIWTIISASPMYDSQGVFVGALRMVTDITSRKQNEEMVWWQAYHDTLTGLPNRALLEDRLGQILVMSHRQKAHIGVMFIDLDRFKQVNDSLGHGLGDRLLKIVAERLVQCLRAEDTIARMGGDEFAVLLPGIEQPEAAVKVAQKLLDSLAQPVEIDGQELFATGSIGISLYPIDGEDTQALLKHADIAMYRAKEQGGNGYYLFTQAMNTSALEHLIMENSLRKALVRNEFHLVYQPQVDLDTGEIIAVEALCRWRHPDLGVVQPAQFIPLAEETGIIMQLGEWVLRESCRQAAQWCFDGHPLRVSVNISARQFTQPGLADLVAHALAESNLDPTWLDLELTESAIMKNAEAAVDILRSLRNLGVRLSLDDFGTGYSSLSYLRQFPFDVLKIDRTFVANVVADTVDQAVVRAIIELARGLNLMIVSEGVEGDDQCRTLQDLGCNIMQGYLFSPPVMPERISALRPLLRVANKAA